MLSRVLNALVLIGAVLSACHYDPAYLHKKQPFQQSDRIGVEFFQRTRPLIHQAVTTRSAERYRTEFEQATAGELDILVVIDNSGSMSEEQGNLATKLNPLLSHIRELDWQINVITTDSPCSRFADGRPIHQETADFERSFRDAINAGTTGSGEERGGRMAMSSIARSLEDGDCPGEEPWLRPRSSLAVLFVSDEDNCCQYTDSDYTAESFLEALSTHRDIGHDARIYGLISHRNQPCPAAGAVGIEYTAMITRSGGVWGSICDSDYTSTLRRISSDVYQMISHWSLGERPLEETVSVTVDGREWEGRYRIHDDGIEFIDIPPQGSSVEIQYSVTDVRDLIIEGNVRPGTLEIVSPPSLQEMDHDFDRESGRVYFEQSIPQGHMVIVQYIENIDLLHSFPIHTESDTVIDSDQVSCLVNGEPEQDMVVRGQSFVFTRPPPEGAHIYCYY